MPGPGFYDNFKTFDDLGKKRSCTIGKRYNAKSSKSIESPGPAKYNIVTASKLTDNGGHGQTTNKQWKFGT